MPDSRVDFRGNRLPGNHPQFLLRGDIYRRKAGNKRWLKLCEATGIIALEPGWQYRLKLRGALYGSSQAIPLLRPIECNAFTEIEVPLRVSFKDMMDQAASAVPWLDRVVGAEAAKIRSALETSATITVMAKAP
jgi:hypothetical protein